MNSIWQHEFNLFGFVSYRTLTANPPTFSTDENDSDKDNWHSKNARYGSCLKAKKSQNKVKAIFVDNCVVCMGL